MTEKRRGRKRKEEFPDADEKADKPSKDEYAVAKWVRDNVPNKRTKFIGHNVMYFTGSKAVDALMNSKWAKPEKEGAEPFFTSRVHCVDFLDLMLRHKFYHRAKKVPQEKLMDLEARKKKALKEKKKDDKKEKKSDKESEKKESGDQDDNSSHPEGKADTEGEEKKVKKKKVKLDMHLEQVFVDNLDAYVWIYEPTPVYYPIIGTLVVLAAIVICLFPLWPSSVRSIVYYLSVAAACFLVLIITLALIRFVLFSIIWLLTAGKHHLWILPNLTEDVGFFASFWPLYHYEYKGNEDKKKSKSKKSKKGKYKDSDDEDANNDDGQQEEQEAEESKRNNEDGLREEEDEEEEPEEEEEKKSSDEGGGGGEESGSDGSSSGQTGKDFEILDKEELQL